MSSPSLVVAARVAIEIENVALQAPAERAAERRKRLERRGADAVVVIGDLIALALGLAGRDRPPRTSARRWS